MIKKILHNDFISSVLTLFKGSALAQIISLASIFIISRLYYPSQMAILGLFLSITNISSSIFSYRYELAIILPKKEIDRSSLLYGSLIIGAVNSGLFLIISLILNFFFQDFLNKYNLSLMILFLPLSFFCVGLINLFYNYLNHFKEYQILAKSRIVQSFFTNLIYILGGYFGFGAISFILGFLFGNFIMLFMLFKKINNYKDKLVFSMAGIKRSLKEYRNFLIFSSPMAILNSFSIDILVYVLNFIGSPIWVGLYTKANRVVRFPFGVFKLSFTTVFYKKFRDLDSFKRSKFYNLSFIFNLFFALLVLAPVFFWGPELFSFFLGARWFKSGEIAGVLVPYIAVGHATSSVASVFSYYKKNEFTLIWQILFLLGASYLLLGSFATEIMDKLRIFSIFGSLMYFLLFILGIFLITKTGKREG